MGKKIGEVRKTSQEGGEFFKKGAEQGRQAVSDVKEMKKLIDSLPTDVDDEIVSAAKTVEQGTKSDAEHHMQSEVHAQVESGEKKMETSSAQAQEQIDKNDKVLELFREMDNVGSFGKNARSEGGSTVKESTAEFNKAIQENQESVKAANEEYKQSLSDISSTF